MNTKDLEQYLAIIIDLEKNRNIQLNTIRQLDNKISSYKNEIANGGKLNTNTIKSISSQIESPDKIQVSRSGKWLMYFGVYYLGFQGASLGFLAYQLTNNFIMSFTIGIIGAVIGGSIPILIWKKVLKKRRQAKILLLQNQMMGIQESNKRKKERCDYLSKIIPQLTDMRASVCETMRNTEKTLEKYYSVNTIPKKYRHLVAVCMFYDYIINKRTYSIERNYTTSDIGAINMYEEECFKRSILSQLNEINRNLNRIRDNQRVLYNAIQDGNRRTHELLTSIDNNISNFKQDVKNNFEVLKYQNEQKARNDEYMRRIAYHNFY